MRRLCPPLLALLVLAALGPACSALSAQAAELGIPEDLQPEGDGLPVGLAGEGAGGPDHYDGLGYPEDASGLLLLRPDPVGYGVTLRDDPDPWLLYAQFVNRQRDAVLLARSGDLQDVLPSGEAITVPYGHGALKTNTVYVSVVEGRLVPHLSDDRKEYRFFPLEDWYLGAAFGFDGLAVGVQYVRAERWVAYGSLGLNPLGALGLGLYAPFNWYALPLHLGGGVRFPGPVELLIGKSHWTVGGDLLLGVGDRDRDPATPAFVWMPGVFLEVEKSRPVRSARKGGKGTDHREDARPWNHRLEALYLRLGLYLDVQNAPRSAPLKLDLTLGWRTAVSGPRLPEHPFKETRVVYLHDEYRRDLERQRERREERLQRAEP